MKRMDGMRPVAPVVPAASVAAPEVASTLPLGGARPIPAVSAAAPISPEARLKLEREEAVGDGSQDKRFLRLYHAVICHRKRGDEPAVQAVWTQQGYTPGSWAEAVGRAVMRSKEDSDGFGKAWSETTRKPCDS